MEERLKLLEKALYGNGQKGLLERMTIIEERAKTSDLTQCAMSADMKLLSTSFASLAKSQLERDINEKSKIEFKDKMRKSLVLIISIISVATPITIFIFNLTKT